MSYLTRVVPPNVLAASLSAVASVSCTVCSCMPKLSVSGPELYRTHPCLRSCSQAWQFHLVRVGSQVSACRFAVISRGRCT